MAFDPFGQKRRLRRARARGAAKQAETKKRQALVKEQETQKKEFERRAELSKTRNLLGLRAESALTTPQVDPGLLKRPEDIEAKITRPTDIEAVRTPRPASALTSPVDTSAADERARSVTPPVDTKSIMERKKKRSEAVSAIGSQTAERKRLLTSALG